MKCLSTTLLALSLFTIHSFAQLRLPINNALRSDFQKVITEYTLNFQNIRGGIMNQNPQTTEYYSRLKLPDAQECIITKYSSNGKAIYSWQAIMFVSEDYETAVKKYKWLFQQLKGSNIYYVKDQYSLRGKYEQPDESRKFTTSVLTVAAPPTPLEKLKVEVSLQFEFPEWKVSLLVFEKEREDYEQGEIAD